MTRNRSQPSCTQLGLGRQGSRAIGAQENRLSRFGQINSQFSFSLLNSNFIVRNILPFHIGLAGFRTWLSRFGQIKPEFSFSLLNSNFIVRNILLFHLDVQNLMVEPTTLVGIFLLVNTSNFHFKSQVILTHQRSVINTRATRSDHIRACLNSQN